jgi:hypothetical protein
MTLTEVAHKANGKLIIGAISFLVGIGVSYGIAVTRIDNVNEKANDQEQRLRKIEAFVAGQAELNKNIERMLEHLNK